jgi:hypothetical protein
MAGVGTSTAKFDVMKFDGTGKFGITRDGEGFIWDKTK